MWARSGVAAAVGQRPPFILCYHGVGDPDGDDRGGLFVSRAQFAEHLDVISARGYKVVTVSELWLRFVLGEANGYGAISFDDALVKTGEEAIPELVSRQMPSTMYVATGLLGKSHPDLCAERIMTRAQVSELDSAGVEIGAHSVDHSHLAELSYDDALAQLTRSRDELEQLVGKPVTTMAYPFGEHSSDTIRAVVAARYQTACACAGPGPWNPFSLPREPIFPSITKLRLQLKMAGLYGPVHKAVSRLHGPRAVEAEAPLAPTT